MTGQLPAQHGGLPLYDWGGSFLNTHQQYRAAVLEGDFYTPELMVVGDITSHQINKVRRYSQNANKMTNFSTENLD